MRRPGLPLLPRPLRFSRSPTYPIHPRPPTDRSQPRRRQPRGLLNMSSQTLRSSTSAAARESLLIRNPHPSRAQTRFVRPRLRRGNVQSSLQRRFQSPATPVAGRRLLEGRRRKKRKSLHASSVLQRALAPVPPRQNALLPPTSMRVAHRLLSASMIKLSNHILARTPSLRHCYHSRKVPLAPRRAYGQRVPAKPPRHSVPVCHRGCCCPSAELSHVTSSI